MRSRLGLGVCIFIGSFFLYCTQSAMTEMGHGTNGGPVGNAMGDPCCSPPAREAPTVIFDDLVAKQTTNFCTQISPVFDVSAYRTIVIHTQACQFVAQFRNGKAGFVRGAEEECP